MSVGSAWTRRLRAWPAAWLVVVFLIQLGTWSVARMVALRNVDAAEVASLERYPTGRIVRVDLAHAERRAPEPRDRRIPLPPAWTSDVSSPALLVFVDGHRVPHRLGAPDPMDAGVYAYYRSAEARTLIVRCPDSGASCADAVVAWPDGRFRGVLGAWRLAHEPLWLLITSIAVICALTFVWRMRPWLLGHPGPYGAAGLLAVATWLAFRLERSRFAAPFLLGEALVLSLPVTASRIASGGRALAQTWRATVRPWIDRHVDALLAVMAVAWTVLLFRAFRPGLMSPDSVAMYAQGVRGDYLDWYPPGLSWTFGLAGRLTGSPWPLLMIQLLALSAGMALLARPRGARRPFTTALPFVAFLAAPPVWSIGVTVWSDVWMAAALLAAVAALRYRRWLVALAGLSLAVVFRHNAFIAAVPLLVPATSLVPRIQGSAARRTLAAALALGVFAAAPLAVARLLDARKTWILGHILVHDLAGIYRLHPELVAGSIFASEMSAEDVALRYTPLNAATLYDTAGPGAGRRIAVLSLAPRKAALVREWIEVVACHPADYAEGRVRMFSSLLGFRRVVCDAFWEKHNPPGFSLHEEGTAYRALRAVQGWTRDSLLFRGWLWLAASALGMLAARGRPEGSLALWTAASGAAYAAAYVFVAPACSFKYLYWTVVAVFAAWASCAQPRPTVVERQGGVPS